jgi:hypothetical protein
VISLNQPDNEMIKIHKHNGLKINLTTYGWEPVALTSPTDKLSYIFAAFISSQYGIKFPRSMWEYNGSLVDWIKYEYFPNYDVIYEDEKYDGFNKFIKVFDSLKNHFREKGIEVDTKWLICFNGDIGIDHQSLPEAYDQLGVLLENGDYESIFNITFNNSVIYTSNDNI